MDGNRKYVMAVALLAVLAVVFGLAGTVAPLASDAASPPEDFSDYSSSSLSSDSATHFANPPTYDSGWVDIRKQTGRRFALRHDLGTTQVFVDITGKRRLNTTAGDLAWKRACGGSDQDYALSVVETADLGYALAGYTESYGAGGRDFWLVKTYSLGGVLWNQTYGGANDDRAGSVVQTADGGFALLGRTASFGAGGYDFWLVKTDAAGVMQWSQTYGQRLNDYGSSLVQTADGGYVLAGYTESVGAGGYDFWLVKTDASGVMQWSQTYGGSNDDIASSVAQTVDGGYALVGRTASFGAGGYDFWLVKTDSSGAIEWDQTYGGANADYAGSVAQTIDEGYVLAGYTESYGAGGRDFWLVKADAAGVMQWSQTYGGAGTDEAYSVVETSDGGYVLAGYTDSFGVLFIYDSWLVKTDASGIAQWNRTYGGVDNDYARSVVETVDGGFVLAGYTNSFSEGSDYDCWLVKTYAEVSLEHQWNLGGQFFIPGSSALINEGEDDYVYSMVQAADGGYAMAGGIGPLFDFWLVKTDASGAVEWSQTYGGANEDRAWSVAQAIDGGYVLAGHTESYGAGGRDFWLVKTDALGTMQWSQTYGGANEDTAYSVAQAIDGGYVLAGHTNSYGAGNRDFWLVKTDVSGAVEWSQTYGGANNDYARSVAQTIDEGYVLAGYTESYGAGDRDFWLVKTDAAGVMQWSQTYGGPSSDDAESVIETIDGGYVLAGYTESYGAGNRDFWLVKTDDSGTVQWNQTYGGADVDHAHDVIETAEGGYALAGSTISFGSGWHDFWLVKTDASGGMQWYKTYGGAAWDVASSVVETDDGDYVLAGYTNSFGPMEYDGWFVRTDHDSGLIMTGLSAHSITLYRGETDPHWNYVRVRIWLIKEPTWIYGDINQDGVVDVQDLFILSQNYGKTVSLLSLGGIVTVAGIHTVKKRKRSKQPNYIG